MLKTITYISAGPDHLGWKERHVAGVRAVLRGSRVRGGPLVGAIEAWIGYAFDHQERNGAPIGRDGFCGPAWEAWGHALRTLLNGDTGAFDCGTLDHIIAHNLRDQGFDPDA